MDDVVLFQAKRKLELDIQNQNEGFKTPAKYKRQRTRSEQSPKGLFSYSYIFFVKQENEAACNCSPLIYKQFQSFRKCLIKRHIY